MNRILILALILIFPFSINAQWGILGGLNTSRSTDNDANQQSMGYQIGVFRDISLTKNIFLRPFVFFSNENLKKKIEGESSMIKYNIYESDLLKITETAYYITIPISLNYKIQTAKNSNITIGLGGYIACGLFGNNYYEIWDSFTYWKSPDTETFPSRKRLDSGIFAALSYETKKFIYSVDAKYGLNNIDPLIENKGKLESYYFNIGFKF